MSRDYLLDRVAAPWRKVAELFPIETKLHPTKYGAGVIVRRFLLECGHARRVTGLGASTMKIGDRYQCKACPEERVKK